MTDENTTNRKALRLIVNCIDSVEELHDLYDTEEADLKMMITKVQAAAALSYVMSHGNIVDVIRVFLGALKMKKEKIWK